jgi:glucokinase
LVNCPLAIENDAKAGGLSEATMLINEFNKVLYITLGTGIGYSYIVDGSIDQSTPDLGGKTVSVTKDGTVVGWESLASGRAIVQRFGQTASRLTDPAKWQQFVDDLSLGLRQLLDNLSPEVIVVGGGVATSFERFGSLLQASLHQASPRAPLVRQAKQPDHAVVYGCYQLAQQIKDRRAQTA